MAVTRGHGNPKWTRDEVILALDLYFDLQGQIPHSENEKIQALSRLLRSAPRSTGNYQPTFRNPASILFKLQNLRQVATGTGLPNTARMDKEVWADFGLDPLRVKVVAQQIRLALREAPPVEVDDHAAMEFAEGRLLSVQHFRRERDPALRRTLLVRLRSQGPLACGLCFRASPDFSPALGESVFECHHLVPISWGCARKNRVSDLALLCANCHRLIHALIVRERRWMTLEEARKHLA